MTTVRLNCQGLARRDVGLMSSMVPDDGCVFVSVDLSAGEPTVTSHYSKDANYLAACFNMVGKTPFYDRAGVLQIDDIYLMGMSVSPMGKAKMREVFDRPDFAETWAKDPEVVQKQWLKKERQFHKTLILALGYGQGPKGMVINARDNGYVLTLADAKAFHKAYWEVLFPGLGRLQLQLQARFERTGSLINAFGYRMVPEHKRLCLNFFIQSSVSGIMKVWESKFFASCPEAAYVTTIHDETIFQIPKELVEHARKCAERSTISLNDDLRWSVAIRTGFAVGDNLYEAK